MISSATILQPWSYMCKVLNSTRKLKADHRQVFMYALKVGEKKSIPCNIAIFCMAILYRFTDKCWKYKLNFLGNRIIKISWFFSPLVGAKHSLSGEVIENAIKVIEVRWTEWERYLIRWNRWWWQSFTLGKWFAFESIVIMYHLAGLLGDSQP